ncbi:MAG: alkaline phosphatase family protein [Ignavibacteriota bacterium]
MKGLSMRNYGFVVENRKEIAPWGGDQIARINDRAMEKVTNHAFRGFDLDYSDIDRARTFLADLAQYEKSGDMPRLMVMRLPNDHTSGVAPGKLSPLAYNADNDQAVGMIVEGISKSKFWGSTAIFILEDDAQNGPDHVDSHRSPAFVISPYVKHHQVDRHMYNTTSMLRTIELILGLRPMTQFDAAAPADVRGFPVDARFGAVYDREAAHAARRAQSRGRRRASQQHEVRSGRRKRRRRVERSALAGDPQGSAAGTGAQLFRKVKLAPDLEPRAGLRTT